MDLFALASALATQLILKFIELVSVQVDTKKKRLVLSLTEETNHSTTERIKKLDEAKESLVDGLKAIEELKEEADLSKREANKALKQISDLENNKASLEEELKHVKNLIKADVSTFRKVAGLSDADIQKERILGFISGVLASIIASGIIGGTVWVFNKYITTSPLEQEVKDGQEL